MGKKIIIKSISAVLSITILFSTVAFSVSAKTSARNYPCIFVHGLLGWGEEADIYSKMPYWGMGSDDGDLMESLTKEGYDCYAASVGALSSSWDRACELYAQLAGTVVDYGEAHSAEHNHSRYGKSYVGKAVIDNFEKTKVNLFGHSFGGNTIRLFTYILENGVPDEVNASKDVSAFFKGGKGNLVNSVTTLSSPHNGSVIADFAYSIYVPMYIIGIVSNALGASGTTALDARFYQFGISTIPGETPVEFNWDNIKTFIGSNDNAIYDLKIGASLDLNDKIDMVDGVYYFSYYCCGTKDWHGYQIPTDNIGASLVGGSLLIGFSKGFTVGGIKLNGDWLANDGMVPVASGMYPLDEAHTEYKEGMKTYKSGIWYVMPVIEGNHGTLVGAGLDDFVGFYKEHIDFINSL